MTPSCRFGWKSEATPRPGRVGREDCARFYQPLMRPTRARCRVRLRPVMAGRSVALRRFRLVVNVNPGGMSNQADIFAAVDHGARTHSQASCSASSGGAVLAENPSDAGMSEPAGATAAIDHDGRRPTTTTRLASKRCSVHAPASLHVSPYHLDPYNARRQLQAARNRRKGNHARIEGAPTDSCTP